MTVLEEGQVEILDHGATDGLVMGPGTPYGLRAFNPWSRSVRSDMGDIPQDHGSYSGSEWRESPTIGLRIHVKGSSAADWDNLHQDLQAAFDAVGTTGDKILRWRLKGQAEPREMRGRPRLVDPEARMLGTGRIVTAAAFVALDPRIYGPERTRGPIALPTLTGGLTVPFTVPFSIGSTLLGGFTDDLANTGILEAPLLLRFDGPLDAPRIVLTRSDGVTQAMQLAMAIPAGEYVEIDNAAKTVLLNDSTPRYGAWSGDWLAIPRRGSADLIWRASDITATGTLTVRWRDTW